MERRRYVLDDFILIGFGFRSPVGATRQVLIPVRVFGKVRAFAFPIQIAKMAGWLKYGSRHRLARKADKDDQTVVTIVRKRAENDALTVSVFNLPI